MSRHRLVRNIVANEIHDYSDDDSSLQRRASLPDDHLDEEQSQYIYNRNTQPTSFLNNQLNQTNRNNRNIQDKYVEDYVEDNYEYNPADFEQNEDYDESYYDEMNYDSEGNKISYSKPKTKSKPAKRNKQLNQSKQPISKPTKLVNNRFKEAEQNLKQLITSSSNQLKSPSPKPSKTQSSITKSSNSKPTKTQPSSNAPTPPEQVLSPKELEVPRKSLVHSNSTPNIFASSKQQRERMDTLEKALKEQQNEKPHVNLVVVGHVDQGKSTLLGHLLYLMGAVDRKLIHKYEKESKALGKASFHFAWVLDSQPEERERGITFDVALKNFETSHRRITVLDCPGHRDFIPAMISGTASADSALLVVSSNRGEFESGFSEEGQTREHAILAKSLGVTNLIVCVNKLENSDWQKDRFDEIVAQLFVFLRSNGFKDDQIHYVPVSGLSGENLLKRSEPKLAWYRGPTLIELIDNLSPPKRHSERPFRLCVSDIYKSVSLGLTLAGRVESGCVVKNDNLLLLPMGETISVRNIEIDNNLVPIGLAGDQVALGIKEPTDPNVLLIGQYLCSLEAPIPLVTRFRAQVITMNYKVPLLKGSQLLLYQHSNSVEVSIDKLISVNQTNTRIVPRLIPRQSNAVIDIISKCSICLELFRQNREMGRFTLRRGDETVAVGIVTELLT